MKRVVVCGILAVVLGMALIAASITAAPSANKAGTGTLRHVVLFKFKDGTTPQQVRAIEEAFAALPSKVPQIAGFEWGTDVSIENRSEGFTHCFLVTFNSVKDRDTYLPHPAHKEFGKIVGPHLDKVLVFDYVAK